SIGAIDRLSVLVAGHRTLVEAEHEALSEQRRRQSDEVRALNAALDAARKQRQGAERSLDETRQKSHRADIDEAEAKLRLENAIETLRKDLDIEPAVAEAA